MKIWLFGGVEISVSGQYEQELALTEEVIINCNPSQILHIPFARSNVANSEIKYWGHEWFKKMKKISNIEFLNADKESDLDKIKNPIVFISGGNQHVNLINKITANDKIYGVILNAENIIGSSAGAMVLGNYFEKVKMVVS